MIRGLDVVQKVAEVEVDAKFRPVVPVVVSNSGELELRRPPRKCAPPSASQLSLNHRAAKPASEESVSDGEDSRSRKRKSRRRSPSSGVSSDEERDRKRKYKSKKSKHRKHRSCTPDAPVTSTEPRQETEEEYDARLEREEKERIAAQHRRELERLSKAQDTTVDSNGVRFKGVFPPTSPTLFNNVIRVGRGRMKYVDPEMHRERDRAW